MWIENIFGARIKLFWNATLILGQKIMFLLQCRFIETLQYCDQKCCVWQGPNESVFFILQAFSSNGCKCRICSTFWLSKLLEINKGFNWTWRGLRIVCVCVCVSERKSVYDESVCVNMRERGRKREIAMEEMCVCLFLWERLRWSKCVYTCVYVCFYGFVCVCVVVCERERERGRERERERCCCCFRLFLNKD